MFTELARIVKTTGTADREETWLFHDLLSNLEFNYWVLYFYDSSGKKKDEKKDAAHASIVCMSFSMTDANAELL
jgi:hypothetical protein